MSIPEQLTKLVIKAYQRLISPFLNQLVDFNQPVLNMRWKHWIVLDFLKGYT